MSKNLGLIDIFKLIFAIGIVCIHSLLFNGNDTFSWLFMHGFLRLGVPFFFFSSGYFLYKKLIKSNDIEKAKKDYLNRLSKPFIFWLILNLPIVLYNYYKKGYGIKKIILILIRSILFYPWGAMWYVLALIVAVIIIIPFYKKGKIKRIVFIGALFYLFALLCNTYYFLVNNTNLKKIIDILLTIISSPRNGIFVGLYFVSCGMYISDLIEKNKISYKKNYLIFIISYILLIIEIIITKNYYHIDDHSLFILFITLIPSLFVFLSQYNINFDTKIFRNYSTGIYFSHRFLLGIVTLIINQANSLLVFFITIFIDVILLSICYKIDDKNINQLIK